MSMRVPRPLARQLVSFQLLGREDVPVDMIQQQVPDGMSVSTRPPRFTGDKEVVIRTNSGVLTDEEFEQANRAVRQSVLNTHEVEGWRVEVA